MIIKSILVKGSAILAVVSFNANAALVGRLEASPGSGLYHRSKWGYEKIITIQKWLFLFSALMISIPVMAAPIYDDTDPSKIIGFDSVNVGGTLYIAGINPVFLDVPLTYQAPEVYADPSSFAIALYNAMLDYQSGVFDATDPAHAASRISTSTYINGCEKAVMECLVITLPEGTPSSGFAGGIYDYDLAPSDWMLTSPMPWLAGPGDGASPYLTGVYWSYDPVPLPAAAWLFGSGLLGLIGIARRKKS